MLPGIVLKFLQQTQILPSQGSVGSWYACIVLCKQKFTKIPSHVTCHLAKTAVFMPWHNWKVCQLKLHNASHLACAEFRKSSLCHNPLQSNFLWRKMPFLFFIYTHTHVYTHIYIHTYLYIYIYIKTSCLNFVQEYQKPNFSYGICSKMHCPWEPSHCA